MLHPSNRLLPPAVLLAMLLATALCRISPADELSHFITRRGDQLFGRRQALSFHLRQHPESPGDRGCVRIHQSQPVALSR